MTAEPKCSIHAPFTNNLGCDILSAFKEAEYQVQSFQVLAITGFIKSSSKPVISHEQTFQVTDRGSCTRGLFKISILLGKKANVVFTKQAPKNSTPAQPLVPPPWVSRVSVGWPGARAGLPVHLLWPSLPLPQPALPCSPDMRSS